MPFSFSVRRRVRCVRPKLKSGLRIVLLSADGPKTEQLRTYLHIWPSLDRRVTFSPSRHLQFSFVAGLISTVFAMHNSATPLASMTAEQCVQHTRDIIKSTADRPWKSSRDYSLLQINMYRWVGGGNLLNMQQGYSSNSLSDGSWISFSFRRVIFRSVGISKRKHASNVLMRVC